MIQGSWWRVRPRMAAGTLSSTAPLGWLRPTNGRKCWPPFRTPFQPPQIAFLGPSRPGSALQLGPHVGPYLEDLCSLGPPTCGRLQCLSKLEIFTWQLLWDRLSSGVEVTKWFGPRDGTFPLCAVPETWNHIIFSCPAARFLWSFIAEALGLEWEAQEVGRAHV